MKKDEMSAAEKKRIEVLDKKIEKLKSKVDKKHQEFAALNDELLKLIYTSMDNHMPNNMPNMPIQFGKT